MVLPKVALLGLLLVWSNHAVGDGFRFLVAARRYDLVLLYVGVWVAALVWLWMVSLAPRLRTRILWGAPFVLFGLLADIHFGVLQAPLNIDQVEAYWNMRFWIRDGIGMYGELMVGPSLRALACLVLMAVPPVLPRLRVTRLALLPGLGLIAVAAVVYRTGGYGIAGLPAQLSTPALLGVFAAYDLSLAVREPVRLPRVGPRLARRVLLVVDESIRGDFVDLRSGSTLTPFLASLGNRVVGYGIATPGSNCSQASNAMLRMGANPQLLGIQGDNLLTHTTIWQYARAAGYETSFIDAQATRGILINYMNARERNLIDTVVQVEGRPTYDKDRTAAARIREILRREQPQFVYLNKTGAHFPYDRAVPPETDPARPASLSDYSQREARVAAYARAVRWSVDGFFGALLAGLDLRDTVLVYTSDHGQNLLEDGDPVTHCREVPTVYEAMVPLLVFTDHPVLSRRFTEAAVRNRDAASHFQIFPTILELFGYDPDAARTKYHLTLFDATVTRVGITSGAVFGRFGKTPKWTALPARMPACCHDGRAGVAMRQSEVAKN